MVLRSFNDIDSSSFFSGHGLAVIGTNSSARSATGLAAIERAAVSQPGGSDGSCASAPARAAPTDMRESIRSSGRNLPSMRNRLDDSSVAQRLDGNRLTGRLHVPDGQL